MRGVVNTPTPDMPDPVEIQQVPYPEPADDQVLLQVGAFSVNRGELALIANRRPGWRPGQDVAGVVLREAADGSGPPVGTRVVGMVDQAGWAEQVALSTSRLTALPDEVSIEQAAALPMAGLTALRTLRLGGDLLGRRVLITGANGGVGRFHIELAAAAGARVTAVTTRLDKADELTALGADSVVGTVGDAEDTFHLVQESVGGSSLVDAIAKIAPRGTVVVLGNSSNEPAPISVYDFIGHEGARLQNYMSYQAGQADDADLRILVELVASGRLNPTLGHVADWTELNSALIALRERKIEGGKVVLTVPHTA
ncbi:zinc-binding dehydrogenase [Saccharopolyspora taberi]|uniref:Zinc-binding dehydrogenase n=1 Tax=Saccharopolyspora taberi TaxID=60895 RepID=A0ABN3VD67_9PSEU